jgi:hypothetical protein
VLQGWLGEERMREILSARSFVCHKDTSRQCAGHMLIKGMENDFVQLANRLAIPLKLSGNELIFETESACIEHHRHIDHQKAKRDDPA